MKRLLILLTVIMAVTADTASVTSSTVQVSNLVKQAKKILEDAASLQYQNVAFNSRKSSKSTPDHADAAENALTDINHALHATREYEANLSIRGKDAPTNLIN